MDLTTSQQAKSQVWEDRKSQDDKNMQDQELQNQRKNDRFTAVVLVSLGLSYLARGTVTESTRYVK